MTLCESRSDGRAYWNHNALQTFSLIRPRPPSAWLFLPKSICIVLIGEPPAEFWSRSFFFAVFNRVRSLRRKCSTSRTSTKKNKRWQSIPCFFLLKIRQGNALRRRRRRRRSMSRWCWTHRYISFWSSVFLFISWSRRVSTAFFCSAIFLNFFFSISTCSFTPQKQKKCEMYPIIVQLYKQSISHLDRYMLSPECWVLLFLFPALPYGDLTSTDSSAHPPIRPESLEPCATRRSASGP